MAERFGRAGEAVLVSGIGAALTAAALLVGLRMRGDRPLTSPLGDPSWYARKPGWLLASGFHPPEKTPEGTVFVWTEPRAVLSMPALARSVPYDVVLRSRAPRPPEAAPPVVTLSADGAIRGRFEVNGEPRDLTVELPAGTGTGLDVVLEVTGVLHRGTAERPRDLGIAVERISLRPRASALPLAASVLVPACLATATYVLAAVLCGLTRAAALAVALLVSAAHAWLLLRQAAFLRGYGGSLLWLGLVMVLAASVVCLARGRVDRTEPRGRALWSVAAFLALGFALLKLALFLHPAALVGDAHFQANRAQRVVNGDLFFTSVTPKPAFEFPYPIALYVLAAPLWRLAQDHVLLLRAIVLAADAGAALAVYAFARAAWREPGTALAACALYALVPVGLDTFATGNLTNDFGQAVFVVAVALLAMAVARFDEPGARRGLGPLLVAIALLAAAFLSHFSTFVVGLGALGAMTAVLAVACRPKAARGMAAALLAAAVVSYGLYYSHFHDTYRQTLARVRSGEGRDLERSIASGPLEKLPAFVNGARAGYGEALILAAAGGGLLLGWRRERGALTLCLYGWAAGIAAFALLGILTPVEMRSLLAGQPVVALLAAFALAAAWTRPILRPLVVLAGAAAVAIFLRLAASVPG